MLLRLLLLFTLVPLVELWILFAISEVTGALFTITLVIVTGIVGAALAKRQGWQTWRKLQQQLAEGQPLGGTVLDGVLILLAGGVLITPGVLTDAVGFALLIPQVRAAISRRLTDWFKARATVHFQQTGPADFTAGSPRADETVIDAEYTSYTVESEESGR